MADAFLTSDPFPVFSPDGTMQGNLTSNQGQTPSPDGGLPALPSLFPAQTVSGASSGSTAGGSSSVISPTSPVTMAAPSNPTTPAPAAASGLQSGSIADYFLRGVIIILGFIFVAIGLNMFRPGIVPNPANLVRR